MFASKARGWRGVLASSLLAASMSLLMSPAMAQAPMAEGEVRRLDLANAKVTIRHGEIKSLDMPPMTMVFTARPPSILKDLQVGDRIRFEADEQNSQYIVTRIEKIQAK